MLVLFTNWFPEGPPRFKICESYLYFFYYGRKPKHHSRSHSLHLLLLGRPSGTTCILPFNIYKTGKIPMLKFAQAWRHSSDSDTKYIDYLSNLVAMTRPADRFPERFLRNNDSLLGGTALGLIDSSRANGESHKRILENPNSHRRLLHCLSGVVPV